jgi:hypothetical protein
MTETGAGIGAHRQPHDRICTRPHQSIAQF